jgi:hypothetical protein
MISSTSPSDKSARPDALGASGQQPARSRAPRSDHLSTDSARVLHEALVSQPEIRSEVVERARALAADPSYPPADVIRSVGAMILAAPDLSEDES